jgi:hypothetical protein
MDNSVLNRKTIRFIERHNVPDKVLSPFYINAFIIAISFNVF